MASIPRYLEIAEFLRAQVAAAEPGARVSSEAELCDRFSVSRMTVRQAMQVLEAEGLLERRQGHGSFARARRLERDLGSALSFTESMRRRGAVASSQVLRSSTAEATDDEAAALAGAVGGEVIVLERLRLADGTPMAIERVVMPPDLASVLNHDLERGSLHAAFERLGRVPTEALAHVGARLASKRERVLLNLDPPGVILSETRTIADQFGVPLEFTSTFYAADRYAFTAVVGREDS